MSIVISLPLHGAFSNLKIGEVKVVPINEETDNMVEFKVVVSAASTSILTTYLPISVLAGRLVLRLDDDARGRSRIAVVVAWSSIGALLVATVVVVAVAVAVSVAVVVL